MVSPLLRVYPNPFVPFRIRCSVENVIGVSELNHK
jgi:hypothetical protein